MENVSVALEVPLSVEAQFCFNLVHFQDTFGVIDGKALTSEYA